MNNTKLLKRMASTFAMCLILVLVTASITNAASGTRCASNSYNEYSWIGLFIHSMGVEGNYHSNGKKISYSKTRAVTSTAGT